MIWLFRFWRGAGFGTVRSVPDDIFADERETAMCESESPKISGWQGWLDLPKPEISGTGPWVDLSHAITETLSRIPFFPQPRIRKVLTYPPANVTEVQMVVHHGT